MTIAEILTSIIELFNNKVDPDMDVKELVKTIQRANEFSARFTRIHLYQLKRQLFDLKQYILVNSKQPHYEVLAARVLALHNSILQALEIVHKSLRRYLWGQPLLAVIDLLAQSMETCQVLPSAASAKETGLLCCDDIPVLCTKLKILINIYQKTVQEIVRENEFYESPRSYWKIRRKSKSQESIGRPEPDDTKKRKKYDKSMPIVKQTAMNQKSFCNQNMQKVMSDERQNYNGDDKRKQSDREHSEINNQISARPSEVEPDKTSSQLENQQADYAQPLKSASATLVDGGVTSAHLVGQHPASHVRSQVRDSNVLLVCIEESPEQRGSEDTRCHAGLNSDSGNLWRLIGQASDNILEEMLQNCMKELQLEGMMSHWLDDINTQAE